MCNLVTCFINSSRLHFILNTGVRVYIKYGDDCQNHVFVPFTAEVPVISKISYHKPQPSHENKGWLCQAFHTNLFTLDSLLN